MLKRKALIALLIIGSILCFAEFVYGNEIVSIISLVGRYIVFLSLLFIAKGMKQGNLKIVLLVFSILNLAVTTLVTLVSLIVMIK